MSASALPAAWKEDVLSAASDRFERRLTEEMSALRLDVRQEVHDGLTSVGREIATTRVEYIKWSFLFWIGQIAAIGGVVALILRSR